MSAPSSPTPDPLPTAKHAEPITPASTTPNRIPPAHWIGGAAGCAVLLLLFVCGGAGIWWSKGGSGSVGPDVAKFDQNDLEATKRWALNEAKQVDKFRNVGNEIALDKALGKFFATGREHAGKTFRWKFAVGSVERAMVLMRGSWTYPGNTNEQFLSISVMLEVGKVISPSRAAALRPGAELTVSGTITDITMHANARPMVMIRVDDLTVE